MTRVKICGITNLDDALYATKAGADAIGFVFYEKSPRYINVKKALEISDALAPFVERVGLFVNKSPKEINQICHKAKISLAQIHFDVDEEFCKELDVKYIKVIRVKSKEDILSLQDSNYYLIDSFVKEFGGVGKRVNLKYFDGVDCSKFILAGGLSSENLKDVLKYNFYGVDVSSSVEIEKGKKDRSKVLEFIKMAKNG